MLKLLPIILALTAQIRARPNDSRIIGGSPAEEGLFPFLASLQNVIFLMHDCGAGIVDERHLITAGHCVAGGNPSLMIAYVGSVYLDQGGTYYSISKLTPHPDFDGSNLYNDIGIVTLKTPILFGDNVQIINLPIDIDVLPGSTAVAVGWGVTAYPGGQTPNQLQQLTSQIRDNEECANATNNEVIPGQLCFGGVPGHGLCFGDSGTPLVYYANNKTYAVGVVSQGNPCALGDPDIYTRVSYYLQWIQEQISLK